MMNWTRFSNPTTPGMNTMVLFLGRAGLPAESARDAGFLDRCRAQARSRGQSFVKIYAGVDRNSALLATLDCDETAQEMSARIAGRSVQS